MSAWDKLYYHAVTVHRASIYDGDTILDATWHLPDDLQKVKEPLRWHAIDTAEIRTAKSPIEKELAICAREFVIDLLPEDNYAMMKTVKDKKGHYGVGKRGKYGRLMAYLFTNAEGEIDSMGDLPTIDLSINFMMLRNRLAYEYLGGRKPTTGNAEFWPDWHRKYAETLDPLLERYAA